MEEEYIVVEKTFSEFQKLLNQWRHIYEFIILKMAVVDNKIVVIIKREDKRELNGRGRIK